MRLLRYAILGLLLCGASCSDAGCAKTTRYGNKCKVQLWSGGKAVLEWTSSGRVHDDESGGGYYFVDAESKKLIRVQGDVSVEEIEQMIVHRGKAYKDTAELVIALEAENKALSERVQLAIIGLELLEQNCPCGARPESIATHPHVTCCLVEVTLRKVRGNAPVGQGPARTL